MKKIFLGIMLFSLSTVALAETIPFDLSIKGGNIDFFKAFELSDVGGDKTKVFFNFKDKNGKNIALI